MEGGAPRRPLLKGRKPVRVGPGGANLASVSSPLVQPPAALGQRRKGRTASLARTLEFGWYAAALLFVAVAGLIRLDVPLHGDPALFLFYAGRLQDGFRLYVDFWDVKPPAIFAFYQLGGNLFGFTDRGVHALEILWMMALAVGLMVGLRPYLRQTWLAAVAPVAIIGVFYALCGAEAQTQVETLANLPTLLCVLALARAAHPASARARYAALAGIAAALTTVFKVIFAPIFIALVLVTSVAVLRRDWRRFFPEVVVRLWLPFSVGVALVWAVVFAAFAAQGTAEAMLWTLFGYPREALTSMEYAPLKRMLINLRMVFGAFAPWLIFVVLALPLLWRRGGPLIVRLMVTWLVAGFLVIVLQRTSWWFYHFMLLLTPIGVLATFGIDRATTFVRRRADLSPVQAMGIGCLLVLPAAGSLVGPLAETATWLAPVLSGEKPVESFKEKFENYAEISAAAAFVRDQQAAGPVMVFESPLVNLLSGRENATPIHGFNWSWILPRQYDETLSSLQASPPPFVFVGTHYEERVRRLSPGVFDLLADRYRLAWESPFGRWYALTNPDTH